MHPGVITPIATTPPVPPCLPPNVLLVPDVGVSPLRVITPLNDRTLSLRGKRCNNRHHTTFCHPALRTPLSSPHAHHTLLITPLFTTHGGAKYEIKSNRRFINWATSYTRPPSYTTRVITKRRKEIRYERRLLYSVEYSTAWWYRSH